MKICSGLVRSWRADAHFSVDQRLAVAGDLGPEIPRQVLDVAAARGVRVIDGADVGDAGFEFGVLFGCELFEAGAVAQGERGSGGK